MKAENDKYIEGTLLSKSKLSFSLNCSECNFNETLTDNVTVDLSAKLVKGVNNFTATYRSGSIDVSKEFNVTAVQKELASIALEYTGRTIYYINEQFDIQGLSVIAMYDNATQEDVTSLVTIAYDMSIEGDKSVEISYGGMKKNIAITVLDSSIKALTAQLNNKDQIFHDGQYILNSQLVVTAEENGGEKYELDNFTIKNPKLSAPQTILEIEYERRKVDLTVEVHALTFMDELESTTTINGRLAHYYCETCDKLFDTTDSRNEVVESELGIPLMESLSVMDNNALVTAFDGKTVAKDTRENCVSASNSRAQYGKIFITYNLSVEEDTEIKLYTNTCVRNVDNKFNAVYSVKVNGVVIDVSDDVKLPYDTVNGWSTHSYTLVGKVVLRAGQNNSIEIIRLNIGNYGSLLRGNYTYNFFGIAVTPLENNEITHTHMCESTCLHCGNCTDETCTEMMCEDKCQGHEGEHFCESICNICSECNDQVCEEQACMNKCDCVEFTVMNDSVTVVDINGNTVRKNTDPKEQNVSANDSDAKKGVIVITYTIFSDKETTAKLYIKTSSQCNENTLADSYSFKVGDNDVVLDDSTMMPYNDISRWTDLRYTCIGEISLTEGVNTIVITRPDTSERVLSDFAAYNFFGIAISRNGAELSFSS